MQRQHFSQAHPPPHQPTTTADGAFGQASSSATSLHHSASQRNTWAPQPQPQPPPPQQRPRQPSQQQLYQQGFHAPQQQQQSHYQQQQHPAHSVPPAGPPVKAPLSRAPSAQDVNNTIASFFDDFGIGAGVVSPGSTRSNKIMDVFDFGASVGGNAAKKPAATPAVQPFNFAANSGGPERKEKPAPPPPAAGIGAIHPAAPGGLALKENQAPSSGAFDSNSSSGGYKPNVAVTPAAGTFNFAAKSGGLERKENQAPASAPVRKENQATPPASGGKVQHAPSPAAGIPAVQPFNFSASFGGHEPEEKKVPPPAAGVGVVSSAASNGLNRNENRAHSPAAFDFGASSEAIKPDLVATPAADVFNFAASSGGPEREEPAPPPAAGVGVVGPAVSGGLDRNENRAPSPAIFDLGASFGGAERFDSETPQHSHQQQFGEHEGRLNSYEKEAPVPAGGVGAVNADATSVGFERNENQAPSPGVFDFGANSGGFELSNAGEAQQPHQLQYGEYEGQFGGYEISHGEGQASSFQYSETQSGDHPQEPSRSEAQALPSGGYRVEKKPVVTPAVEVFNFEASSAGHESQERPAPAPVADDNRDGFHTFSDSLDNRAASPGVFDFGTITEGAYQQQVEEYGGQHDGFANSGGEAQSSPFTYTEAQTGNHYAQDSLNEAQVAPLSYGEAQGANQVYDNSEAQGAAFTYSDAAPFPYSEAQAGNQPYQNSEAQAAPFSYSDAQTGSQPHENAEAPFSYDPQAANQSYEGPEGQAAPFSYSEAQASNQSYENSAAPFPYSDAQSANQPYDNNALATNQPYANSDAPFPYSDSQAANQPYDGNAPEAGQPYENSNAPFSYSDAQGANQPYENSGEQGAAFSYSEAPAANQSSDIQHLPNGYPNGNRSPESKASVAQSGGAEPDVNQNGDAGTDAQPQSQQYGNYAFPYTEAQAVKYGYSNGSTFEESKGPEATTQNSNANTTPADVSQQAHFQQYGEYAGSYAGYDEFSYHEAHASSNPYGEVQPSSFPYGEAQTSSSYPYTGTHPSPSQPSDPQYDQYAPASTLRESNSNEALQNTVSPDFDQRSSVSVNSSASNLMDFKSCPQCAKRNESEANFCGKCGTGLKSVLVTSNRVAPEVVQQAFRPYGGEAPGRPGMGLRPGQVTDDAIPPPAVPRAQPLPPVSVNNMYRSSVGKRAKTPIHGNNGVAGHVAGVEPYQTGRSSPGPQHRQVPAEPPAFRDILGRHRGHCIATFGPGGKLIVTKPMRQTRYISDAMGRPAMVEKTYPGEVSIKSVKSVLDAAALYEHGAGVAPLVGAKSKPKKKDILSIVDHLITDAQNDHDTAQQVFSVNSSDGRIPGDGDKDALAEKHDQVLVVKLLKHLVENDGVVFQSGIKHELSAQAIFSILAGQRSPETATSPVDQIEKALFASDRNGAIQIATSHGLWAHALVIASNVNQDVYRDVVRQFSESQFGPELGGAAAGPPSTRCFKPAMRVIFGLFGGMGPAIISDYLPDAKLALTPVTFELLDAWREVLCIILANRTPGDSAAIAVLGDKLRMYNKRAAAEFCHLVASLPNTIGGFDTPGVRAVLLGADHINYPASFFKSSTALRKTELFEYAQTLLDGAGIANALPHLQAYKVYHASLLADLGLIDEASKYCESIELVVKQYARGSPYFHRAFGEALGSLMAQVAAAKGGAVSMNSSGKEASGWLSKLGSLGARGVEKFMSNALGEPVDPLATNRAGTPTLSHGRVTPGPGSAPLNGISNPSGVPSERPGSTPLHSAISPLPFDSSIATSSYAENFQNLGFQRPTNGDDYTGENFQTLGFPQPASSTLQYGAADPYTNTYPPATQQAGEASMDPAYPDQGAQAGFQPASNFQYPDQSLAAQEPAANGTYPDQGNYAQEYGYDNANQYGQGYQNAEYSQNYDGYGNQQQYDGYGAPIGESGAEAQSGPQNYNGVPYQNADGYQSLSYGEHEYSQHDQNQGAANVPADSTQYGFSEPAAQYGQQPEAQYQNYNQGDASGFEAGAQASYGDEPQGFEGGNEFTEQSGFNEQQGFGTHQGFGERQGFDESQGYQETPGYDESHDFESKESAPPQAQEGRQSSSYYDEKAKDGPPPPAAIPNRAFDSVHDDDDVLGLGNRASVKSKKGDTSSKDEKAASSDADKSESDGKKDTSPTSAAPAKGLFSTIGSLFGGRKKTEEVNKDGPVKANLGEKTSFVYDKKRKKWVNSAATEEEEEKKELAPPPMTASAPAPNLGPPSGNGSPVGSSISLDTMSGGGFAGGGAKRRGARRYVDVLNPDSAKASPTSSMSFLPPTTAIGKGVQNAKILKPGPSRQTSYANFHDVMAAPSPLSQQPENSQSETNGDAQGDQRADSPFAHGRGSVVNSNLGAARVGPPAQPGRTGSQNSAASAPGNRNPPPPGSGPFNGTNVGNADPRNSSVNTPPYMQNRGRQPSGSAGARPNHSTYAPSNASSRRGSDSGDWRYGATSPQSARAKRQGAPPADM
ncbi:vesicle coat component [Geranomyces variabilis]|uniref:Protein transport protein sec16 n=1 Tax=Geranomyces variabilis TaxID=109894 RepID=A0AAD5TS42_9FUNG|nr:vesicle coat component [Geranomyces variabilis]